MSLAEATTRMSTSEIWAEVAALLSGLPAPEEISLRPTFKALDMEPHWLRIELASREDADAWAAALGLPATVATEGKTRDGRTHYISERTAARTWLGLGCVEVGTHVLEVAE